MEKVEKPKQKKKIKVTPNRKTQYGRFVETARKLECDESDREFEARFSSIVPPKRIKD